MSQRFSPAQRRKAAQRSHRIGRGGDQAVAEQLDCAAATVAAWRRREGLTLRHPSKEPAPALRTDATPPAAKGSIPVERLSPSGAATFEQCPRRWKFRYVDKVEEPGGVAAAAGTFVHLVLEQVMALPAAERTVEAARQAATTAWETFSTEDAYQNLGLDDAEKRQFMWRAWTGVEGLWTLEDPAAVDVVATEQNLEADLAGVPFRGIVDRVDRNSDGEVVVSDYKSGKAPPRGYGGRHLRQVLLYAAALRTAGQPVDRVAVLYLGQRPVSVRVTDRLLDDAVGKLASTWENIGSACSTGRFDPKPGPLCGWCPHTAACPEGAAELETRAAAA